MSMLKKWKNLYWGLKALILFDYYEYHDDYEEINEELERIGSAFRLTEKEVEEGLDYSETLHNIAMDYMGFVESVEEDTIIESDLEKSYSTLQTVFRTKDGKFYGVEHYRTYHWSIEDRVTCHWYEGIYEVQEEVKKSYERIY